ncbi:MAG TPA: hypothetical protein VMS55_07415 [Myxococcota bacterium]|nr:hypothetical protein [Myxococcota bacterium]
MRAAGRRLVHALLFASGAIALVHVWVRSLSLKPLRLPAAI